MKPNLPQAVLLCTQCGGELHPDEGEIFLSCPYCNSTVYLDKAQVVFHWYLAPTLNEEQARASLARWMAGNQTVKNLDQKAHIGSQTFEYFPLWYFRHLQPDGREVIALQPAAATSVTELRHLHLPAGDLRRYHASLDSQAHAPTVPLQTALSWAAGQATAGQATTGQAAAGPAPLPAPENGQQTAPQVQESALVHIPLYTFKYLYKDQPYTAIVEGATGGVFANLYPAKAEAPYQLAGGLTAASFLVLATFPVIGALIGSAEGAMLGLLLCSGLGVLAAPVLFAIASWVAAKI